MKLYLEYRKDLFYEHYNLNPLSDLSFTLDDVDIANFGEDNTLNVSRDNLDEVTESLKPTSISSFQWFERKVILKNFLGSSGEKISLNVNNFNIENNQSE